MYKFVKNCEKKNKKSGETNEQKAMTTKLWKLVKKKVRKKHWRGQQRRNHDNKLVKKTKTLDRPAGLD